ncbi:hypothetical protein O3P69_018308 [Scylla paramamosain]|uniref:Uncharacterized protein n=1 Tax=Scylla paramamosain TaxID=85552 RepID=A0AAW0TM53_SCYPA
MCSPIPGHNRSSSPKRSPASERRTGGQRRAGAVMGVVIRAALRQASPAARVDSPEHTNLWRTPNWHTNPVNTNVSSTPPKLQANVKIFMTRCNGVKNIAESHE